MPLADGHRRQGTFYRPAPGEDLEALLVFGSADELDDEVDEGSLVHHALKVVGAVGEEV